MAQLYQWTVPCTICESPVEYHCNTCGDVFCGKCREIHLKSKATRHHVIVPYSQRVEPNQSLDCGDHPGQQCRMWCQTCNKAACSDCVTTPSHRGHIFLKFDDKIGEARQTVQGQFEKLSTLLSDWQTSLQDAKKMEETYIKDVEQLDKEMVDRADELCQQVRAIEKESREQLVEIQNRSLRALNNSQQILTNGIHRLKEKIKELEDSLRCNDSSTILKLPAKGTETKDTQFPSFETPSAPVFFLGSLDSKLLKTMYGCLSEKGVECDKSDASQSKRAVSLLKESFVDSIINKEKGGYKPAIVCVGQSQAWIQSAEMRLQLKNRKGKVTKTVDIDFFINDMSLTPQKNILITSTDEVMTMSTEGHIKTLFHSKMTPHGICCLPSGDTVVTFRSDKRVVQYSSTWKIVKEIDGLFEYPWYIAHSQVNEQLYVCDKTNAYFYDAPGRIMALSMTGRLQYTYTGRDPKTFTPVDVCTDLAGHLLITDYNNQRVHILDKGGNFLQYLLTKEQGLAKPITIDVDDNGYAWIGEYYTKQLKVVKYAM